MGQLVAVGDAVVEIGAALEWLQASRLAVQIRDSLILFPLLEAVHVIGLALVFGTILIVDLRLLGVASTQRSFQRIASDTLRWTVAAFVLTAVTGALMFITNATVYFHNAYFQTKVALLALAGVNAAVFELTSRRTVATWGSAPSAPPLARGVATLSLIIWVGVIVTGRMIGFTATRASLTEPPPVETNFEDLLGLPSSTDPGETPGKAPE